MQDDLWATMTSAAGSLWADGRALVRRGLGQPAEDPALTRLEQLGALPDEKKAAALNGIEPSEVASWLERVPEKERTALGPLLEHATDPETKLKMWAAYHKAAVKADMLPADERSGELPRYDVIPRDASPAQLQQARLELACDSTQREVDEELAHLARDGDGPLTMAKVNELIARKEREHQLELAYGVNLTNDTDESIGKEGDAGDRDHRQRRTWSKEELDRLEAELDRLPPEHRSRMKEVRRASHDYGADGSEHGGTLAQAHWSDAKVEVFDGGAEKGGGVLVHEIGHTVDRNFEEASDRYRKAVGWQDFSDEKALRAQLAKQGLDADAELARLAAATGQGNYGQKCVEIGGKIYQRHEEKDEHGTVTSVSFSAYDADAVPARGHAEKTSDGWADEWDYARTGKAELFAEHYKLAARDPLRLASDLLDRPAAEVADLEQKLAMARTAGGATGPLEQELERARAQRDTLKTQWDIMRGDVYGVNDAAVETASADVPRAQLDAFRAQAQRCVTPAQLAQLQQAYREGKAVDDAQISALGQLLPADQQGAYLRDASRCFSQAQLEKLAGAYMDGKRKDGDWTGRAAGEDPLLGS